MGPAESASGLTPAWRRVKALVLVDPAGWRRVIPFPPRSFARHRTITALEHARALKAQRAEPIVDVRPLTRYDALIA